ncbi:MAG: type II secretion system inner membrane protein GspF [Pseudomonadota bacterium]
MAAFEYVALDTGGKRTKGVITAETARLARKELLRRKLTPLQLSVSGRARRAGDAEGKAQGGLGSLQLGGGALPSKDVALITRQLATLIRAGSPVEEALRAVAGQAEKPALRRVMHGVRDSVTEGYRLSEALRSERKAFTPLYRSMVGADEASGDLGAVLERLADYLEKAQTMRRKITSALIYPAALAVTALSVIVALMVFVVPRVVEQFDSIGQELPGLTLAMIAISSFLRDFGLYLLIALIIGGAAGARALRNPKVRRRFDGALLATPFIGKLVRSVNAARFGRTLSTLIESGAPVLESLDAAKTTVSNTALREAVADVALAVREGGSLSAAMKKADMFPPLMVYMAASGENSGELGPMLTKSADYLEAEFESTTSVVLNLLEPAIIIAMGGIVTTIVLAILMPILKLNSMALT